MGRTIRSLWALARQGVLRGAWATQRDGLKGSMSAGWRMDAEWQRRMWGEEAKVRDGGQILEAEPTGKSEGSRRLKRLLGLRPSPEMGKGRAAAGLRRPRFGDVSWPVLRTGGVPPKRRC